MSTVPKIKPLKAPGKQNTSEQEATEAKSSAMESILPVNGVTRFSPGDWESNTPLRPPVEAAQDIFLSDADQLCHLRLQVAIRAFGRNRFAPAARSVLEPCLNGWIELLVGGDLLVGLRGVPLVQLAINYFDHMLAIAKQNPEIIGKPVPWAESQTRSVLNQLFGTTWFSTPKPEIKAESRKVNLWLREIDETVFVPRPLPDPALIDNKAIVEEWHTWHAHGWLATWLPPSTGAFRDFVDRPLEPLPQEVQDYVVEDITSYLFQGVEDRLKRAVNTAQVKHARPNPANVSQNSLTKPTTRRRSDKMIFRMSVIFNAIKSGKTGLDYCGSLRDNGLETHENLQLRGCEPNYVLAYQRKKFRELIHKEKSRFAMQLFKLQRDDPAELHRILAIANRTPRP